ncbi:hypothetical protein [Streptomyces sp. NPDC050560]|uniref:hypothetical protein n=1 Tax=Streptomyces sp. NPDC050560 TaxID=3365630 RepID=UPI0037B60CDD
MSRSPRILLTALALTATGALLTSCQDDGSDNGKAENAGDSSSASQSTKPPGDESSKTADNAGGSGGDNKVTGTWHGTVTYMAPGKYLIKEAKGGEQAFLTAEATDIEGIAKICGDGGQSATRCTAAQLEAASHRGFSATVTLEKGIATKIAEDHPAGGGSDADQPKKVYLQGVSHYVAPGKYSVTDDGTKKERAFLTTTNTVINGAGWICGTEKKTQRCTTEELDAATKRGVRLVVEITDDGTAVTIDEQHN